MNKANANSQHAIWVEVHVTGDPSEDSDQDVPGVYGHEVFLGRHVDSPAALKPNEASAIATAVLDVFHGKQGIDCLDDFVIEVRYFGVVLSEEPLAIKPDLQIRAVHYGKLSDEEVVSGRPRET